MDALIILRRCMYRIHPQWWSKNYYSSQLPRNWLFPSKYGDFCMLWSIVIDCTFPVYFSWTRVLKLGKFQTGAFSSNTWNCPSSIFVTFRGQKMPPRSIWKKVSTLYDAVSDVIESGGHWSDFQLGMSYLTSLNPQLFKNIAYVGSFEHFSVQLFFYMYSATRPRPALRGCSYIT